MPASSSQPKIARTEKRNPATAEIDRASTAELLRLINEEDQKVAPAVRDELPRIEAALDAIHERFRQGGRMIALGAGTSGRLAVLDASEIPPTFGMPPNRVVGLIAGGDGALRTAVEGAEDSAEGGRQALQDLGLSALDSVVGVAASGNTPFVLGAIAFAREIGAATIGLTTNRDAVLLRQAEHGICPEVGPEVVTGSTRLKSGTAQKLVLNMLSTGLMIKAGCVYGNLMVNVQPTNAKLRDRTERIVMELAGVSRDRAAEVVRQAPDARTAILMASAGIDLAEATRRLQAAQGILRTALDPARPEDPKE